MTDWKNCTEEQKERRRYMDKKYREEHPEWYKNRKKYNKSRYNRDAYRMKKRSLERYHRIKRMIIGYYSNDTFQCKCCGENEYVFLTIDHIKGGGNKHVRSFNSRAGYFQWFIKMNFPPGFQILCYNCNNAKGRYKQCPHEEMRMLNKDIKQELK